MSDTPRTDNCEWIANSIGDGPAPAQMLCDYGLHSQSVVPVALARELERELAEARVEANRSVGKEQDAA